jgi:hypothetical protein
VLAVGRRFRPISVRARCVWGAGIGASVLVANFRSPAWAVFLTAIGIVLITGLPTPQLVSLARSHLPRDARSG